MNPFNELCRDVTRKDAILKRAKILKWEYCLCCNLMYI